MKRKIIKSKRVLPIRGMQIYCETFGSQKHPCLVLIAGAMAPCEFWSDRLCAKAAKQYFVVRYDQRDIGRSSAVDFDKDPYTLKDLAQDVVDVLDHLDVDAAHFVGHSMGGHICQHLALSFQKRVLSITLISSGPIARTPIDEIPITPGEEAILKQSWEMFTAKKEGEDKKAQLRGFMEVWKYLNGTYSFDEELARSYTKALLKSPSRFLCQGNNHEKVMKHVVEDKKGVIEKIQVPTHVIHGNRDPIALPRFGRALGVSIPGAWLDIVDGMGHMFFNQELEKKVYSIIHLYINQL